MGRRGRGLGPSRRTNYQRAPVPSRLVNTMSSRAGPRGAVPRAGGREGWRRPRWARREGGRRPGRGRGKRRGGRGLASWRSRLVAAGWAREGVGGKTVAALAQRAEDDARGDWGVSGRGGRRGRCVVGGSPVDSAGLRHCEVRGGTGARGIGFVGASVRGLSA